MQFLYIFLIIFVAFGLGFIMINIRQIVVGEPFRGTCATNNPMLTNEIGECTVCGSKPGEDCQDPESHVDEEYEEILPPLPEPGSISDN